MTGTTSATVNSLNAYVVDSVAQDNVLKEADNVDRSRKLSPAVFGGSNIGFEGYGQKPITTASGSVLQVKGHVAKQSECNLLAMGNMIRNGWGLHITGLDDTHFIKGNEHIGCFFNKKNTLQTRTGAPPLNQPSKRTTQPVLPPDDNRPPTLGDVQPASFTPPSVTGAAKTSYMTVSSTGRSAVKQRPHTDASPVAAGVQVAVTDPLVCAANIKPGLFNSHRLHNVLNHPPVNQV